MKSFRQVKHAFVSFQLNYLRGSIDLKNLNDFDEFRSKLPVCELKKSLEERLSEGGGQVELLAAVVNLEYNFGAAKQMWLDCSSQ